MHLEVGESLIPGHVTACMTKMSEDVLFPRSGRFGENNQVWFEVHSFFCREIPGTYRERTGSQDLLRQLIACVCKSLMNRVGKDDLERSQRRRFMFLFLMHMSFRYQVWTICN